MSKIHNRKTIPELHCILTARRRICTHQTAASRNIIPTHIRLIGSFNLSTDFRHLIQVTAGIAVATNVSDDIILIWFHDYRLRSVSHCGLSGISVRKLISILTGGKWKAKPSHKILENEVKGTQNKPATKLKPNTPVLHSRCSPKFTHNEWKGKTAG